MSPLLADFCRFICNRNLVLNVIPAGLWKMYVARITVICHSCKGARTMRRLSDYSFPCVCTAVVIGVSYLLK